MIKAGTLQKAINKYLFYQIMKILEIYKKKHDVFLFNLFFYFKEHLKIP